MSCCVADDSVTKLHSYIVEQIPQNMTSVIDFISISFLQYCELLFCLMSVFYSTINKSNGLTF